MPDVRRMFVFLPLLASCAMTTVGSTWRAQNFSGPPLKKVLICALSRDDVTRRLIEDAFVQTLQASGVAGVPCYVALPGARPAGQLVRDAAVSGGYDGIIVTRPASVKEVQTYEGGAGQLGNGVIGFGWTGIYEPEYLRTETEVTIQAKAYSVEGGGELIWGGTSQTMDPSSVKSLVSQVVPKFIDAMAKAGILPEKLSRAGQ